jgi:hypothetical protein
MDVCLFDATNEDDRSNACYDQALWLFDNLVGA